MSERNLLDNKKNNFPFLLINRNIINRYKILYDLIYKYSNQCMCLFVCYFKKNN